MAKSETDRDPVTLAVEAGVATITLNLPERKNSLSPELVDLLTELLERSIADDGVRVVVLTNAGNTFCAGADLKASAPGVQSKGRHSFVDIFRLIGSSPKPVVGRIDGHATGGGVGIVAACDISIMRNDSVIGFTEVRLGVAPAVISVVCLPKLSKADALELFLTGERISPDRAAQARLINYSVEPDQLDELVDRIVAQLLRGGPGALAASKDLIERVPTMDLDAAFDWTAVRSAELFATTEAQAGIAAFRDRVDAPWIPQANEPE